MVILVTGVRSQVGVGRSFAVAGVVKTHRRRRRWTLEIFEIVFMNRCRFFNLTKCFLKHVG
jgi:hypothetical protein